jgi:hypothetical protein
VGSITANPSLPFSSRTLKQNRLLRPSYRRSHSVKSSFLIMIHSQFLHSLTLVVHQPSSISFIYLIILIIFCQEQNARVELAFSGWWPDTQPISQSCMIFRYIASEERPPPKLSGSFRGYGSGETRTRECFTTNSFRDYLPYAFTRTIHFQKKC